MDELYGPLFFQTDAFLEHREHPPLWELEAGGGFGPKPKASFVQIDGGLVNGWRATFGGIAVGDPSAAEQVGCYLTELIAIARSRNKRFIRLSLPPMIYQPSMHRKLLRSALHQGFTIASLDWNYHIPVDQSPYRAHIRSKVKWRWNRANRQGLQVEELCKKEPDRIHSFIESARANKGYAFSMSVEAMALAFDKLGDDYPVFVVKDGSTWAALALCIRTHEKALYTLFLADNPQYLSLSPTVPLVGALYDYCQEKGIKMLDLGTGSHLEKGVPNYGLMAFKQRLGAKVSPKIDLYTTLASLPNA